MSAPSARHPAASPLGGGEAQTALPSTRPTSGYLCPRCGRTFGEQDVIPSNCPDDGTALVLARHFAEQRRDPMIGRDLDGRFTVIDKLGAGSMGTVYRARQQQMMREVAIKILRSDKAFDEPSKARFLREARATSLLASPHTVTVFDFGQCATGELFLAMELLEGESLGQRLTRVRRLPTPAAVETARQALRSLAEAHAKGIVHRDLKPDNLFYARVAHGDQVEELVKVLDFGIAKMLGEGMGQINAIETQAGTVFGTPRYMSPEQAQGKPLDQRSDLYSLGVLLYQMLAGQPPFTDDDAIIVMARHIKTPPKPPREVAPDAQIPPEVEAVVLRALSKDPAQRPPSAEVFSAELTRALEASAVTSGVRASMAPPPRADATTSPDDTLDPASALPSRKSWLGVIFAGAAAALLLVAGVWWMQVRDRGRPTVSAPPTSASIATSAASPSAVASSPAASAAPMEPGDDVPTVDISSLPRSPKTHGTRPPHVRPHPTATAAPSGSESRGRYGILE